MPTTSWHSRTDNLQDRHGFNRVSGGIAAWCSLQAAADVLRRADPMHWPHPCVEACIADAKQRAPQFFTLLCGSDTNQQFIPTSDTRRLASQPQPQQQPNGTWTDQSMFAGSESVESVASRQPTLRMEYEAPPNTCSSSKSSTSFVAAHPEEEGGGAPILRSIRLLSGEWDVPFHVRQCWRQSLLDENGGTLKDYISVWLVLMDHGSSSTSNCGGGYEQPPLYSEGLLLRRQGCVASQVQLSSSISATPLHVPPRYWRSNEERRANATAPRRRSQSARVLAAAERCVRRLREHAEERHFESCHSPRASVVSSSLASLPLGNKNIVTNAVGSHLRETSDVAISQDLRTHHPCHRRTSTPPILTPQVEASCPIMPTVDAKSLLPKYSVERAFFRRLDALLDEPNVAADELSYAPSIVDGGSTLRTTTTTAPSFVRGTLSSHPHPPSLLSKRNTASLSDEVVSSKDRLANSLKPTGTPRRCEQPATPQLHHASHRLLPSALGSEFRSTFRRSPDSHESVLRMAEWLADPLEPVSSDSGMVLFLAEALAKRSKANRAMLEHLNTSLTVDPSDMDEVESSMWAAIEAKPAEEWSSTRRRDNSGVAANWRTANVVRGQFDEGGEEAPLDVVAAPHRLDCNVDDVNPRYSTRSGFSVAAPLAAESQKLDVIHSEEPSLSIPRRTVWSRRQNS